MRRKAVVVFVALALLALPMLAVSAAAGDGTDPLPAVSTVQDNSIDVYYFYGDGCPHCALIEPYIDTIPGKYPQVNLIKLEIYHNSTNQGLYADFNARYGVKDPLIPAVFIGDHAFIAEDEIKDGLEPAIQSMIESGNVTDPADHNNPAGGNNTTGAVDLGPAYPDLTIAMVIGASLVDSINPCAISVMVFLLIFLTSLGNRRRVLAVGGVYIATVFLVYFAAGLGMLAFLQSASITRYVYYIAAVLSIAIGLLNVKDFFFFGKGPTAAIPESRKPMIKKYVEKASVPAAVVLGAGVSLFELPCTGGIYLAILSLLGNDMTMTQGLPYLALYNAIFVLPLGVILAFFYKGVSPERANSWRLEKRRVLKLIIGVVMLVLGAVMLAEAF